MEARDWRDWIRHSATNILRVAIILLFLGLAIWAIVLSHFGLVIASSEPWLLLTDALIDVAPELAGIVIGVVTIDYLNERRQDEQLKKQLILQLGSSHNDVADTAISALRARGWLINGSLKGAYLSGANLSEANLNGANLSGAYLGGVNLSGARLVRANLSGAIFVGVDSTRIGLEGRWANLSKADLRYANLSKADLQAVNLSGANLEGANLSGANLERANLSEANGFTFEQLEQAKVEGAIMPDKVRLGVKKQVDSRGIVVEKQVDGPTFEEWKAQYLVQQEAHKVAWEQYLAQQSRRKYPE